MRAIRDISMGNTTMQGATRRDNGVAIQDGFTLVELMVTIAVLAILLMIGVPSFSGVINSNRLSSGANEFVAALQYARMESMRRNSRVVICRSTDQASCSDGADWTSWVVFVDRDRDGTPDAASGSTPSEVLRVGSLPSPVVAKVSGNVLSSRIFFRPDGRAYKSTSATAISDELLKATVGVCISGAKQPKENQREIRIMSGSRISMAKTGGGTGVCPTLSNPS